MFYFLTPVIFWATVVEIFVTMLQMAQRGPLTDILRDDVKDFQRTWTAMDHMGLSDNEKMAIFAVIAGVLHLGNISFEDDPTDQKGRIILIVYLLFHYLRVLLL